MKFLRVLCVLALALVVTASVYAETQSVKVSGDLTMRGIWRNAYNFQGSPPESTTGAAATYALDSDAQSWFMTVAAVQVDADLTDNVSTVIRILNQRDWNVADKGSDLSNLAPNGRGIYNGNPDEFDVMIDLAYVQLKDFIYSPLTLTIGRQNLWFGKGFIIGANQQNPGSGIPLANAVNQSSSNGGNLSAPEYTGINSFDAVKAVLDYDPWTITAIYSKIYEDVQQDRDDVNLWGVNVGYKFDAYKGEAEAYWFWKQDRSIPALGAIKDTANDVQTIGLRGSFDPINVVTIAAEGAYQGGDYVGSTGQLSSRGRSAWALDVSGELRYFTDRFSWKPKLGVEYIYYSGNEPESNYNVANGDYNGWDPMFRGKYDSLIREFIGKFYQTARYPAVPGSINSCPDDSRTNQHQVIFSGSIQPIESLTLKANYNLFWNQEAYGVGGLYAGGLVDQDKTQGFIGQEVDLQATWDYTEDVSFNLALGWFFPGEVYDSNPASSNAFGNDIASDVVGTVKVSF